MRRPQNLCDTGLLHWIMNNELEKEPDNFEKDCWVAKESRCGGRDSRPLLYYKKKNYLMYRATWEMWNGVSFPEGLQARHLCGNARCINPLHIEPGTQRENEFDKKEPKTRQTTLPITPANISPEEKVDFWLENHTKDVDGCLEFLGCVGSDGYARRSVRFSGVQKKLEVHRYVYAVKNGLDYFDKSWTARHTCHNRSCINPDHIIPGTRSQNSIDSRSYSKSTKLREEEVREVIDNFLKIEEWPLGSKKSFAEEQSKKYGVSPSSTTNIVFSKTRWKDILEEYGLL